MFPSSPTGTAQAGGCTRPAMPVRSRRVVDAPIRVFHALFALSFAGAYLTSEGESMRLLHVTLGYTMAGLLAFRLVYGLVGPRQARLSLLWHKLVSLPQWLGTVMQGARDGTWVAVNWRQGQNLALALAVFALLVTVVPLTGSGYASFNEWGDGWADVHQVVGNVFLFLVLGHLGVVLGLSLLRRQNLAAHMVHGCTEGVGPDLARRNHGWLAILLLVAVLAYWRWEWQQSPNGLISAQTLGALMSGRDDGDD